jgi:YVTN family beta-propeller protein
VAVPGREATQALWYAFLIDCRSKESEMPRLASPAGLVALVCLLVPPAPVRAAEAVQGTLVALNKAEASASLIDLASGRVVATVPTGEGPHEVAVSPDGRRAVVTNYGTRQAPGSSLTLIDIAGARVERTVDLKDHQRPHGVEWLPGGVDVVVTSEEQKALIVVDLEDGRVIRTVKTDQEISHMVAMAPNGRRAFVANIGSGSVSVIDIEKGERLANIPTGEGAEGITVTPGGKEVWVTNRAADTITVLNARSLEIVKEIPCASFPIRAKATPGGQFVLVSNARSGDLAVFDVASKEERHRISMELTAEVTEGRLFGGRFGDSSVPIGILVEPGGWRAYVANANADVISIVDLKEWRTDGYLTAGKEPDGLAYSPLVMVESETEANGSGEKPGS